MGDSQQSIYKGLMPWSATILVAGLCIASLWRSADAWLSPALLMLAAMLIAGVLSAHMTSIAPIRPMTRMALVFWLCALVLLPLPGALLVLIAAGIAGGGRLLGDESRGIATYAALLLAGAIVQALATLLPAPVATDRPINSAIWMALAWSLFQLVTPLMQRLCGSRPASRSASLLALESGCVPLAWLLVEFVRFAAWPQAIALAGLVLLGQAVLLQLSRSKREVRRVQRDLASRVTELDSLHAIGREILSTLEPTRVCAIVEREGRKIFVADACHIRLIDGDATAPPPRAEDSWERWAIDEKRALLAEAGGSTQAASFLADLEGRGLRSGMLAPLVVEDRVIGLLSVESRRSGRFDPHRLAVLTTIAQQAAVALENARNYTMATVDSLTGFFLRDYFFGRLDDEYKRVARYGGQFSLLMIDLDSFKEINDRHGHPAGDQYLRGVSASIIDQLRAADLCCRYGGDEFCLLLPETDLAGARAIAERIRLAIAAKIVSTEGAALRGTASIGVAAFPDHDNGTVAALLRNADEALYRAKRAGRDRVVPFAA